MRQHFGAGYGLMAIALHWVTAVAVLGLFPLGLYMTGLTYYDPLYRTLPFIHRSIGILLIVVVILRLAWRLTHAPPPPLASHARWEQRLAKGTHRLIYLILFAVMASGYLMSTADGRAVPVFGWFEVPATVTTIPQQEEIAGDLHFALAIALMALVGLHVAGALKHHFMDRDATLVRMLRPGADRNPIDSSTTRGSS